MAGLLRHDASTAMDKFFAETVKGKKAPRPEDEGGVDQGQDDGASKTLPKGVVLGKDGKPYVK